MTLDIIWYVVIILALICYAVLDGFDLGVGSLHLFAKKDEDRRIFLNSIGPVWDGNEVWLVIVVGALFAGFPEVYATMLSAFYNLVMALLCGLIFRAAAIEFRSKVQDPRWRKTWDTVFCVASLIIAFGIGVILANLIQGIPLDEHRDFVGTFSGFFDPYSLLVGVMTTALFMMHGAIYLAMKTEGKLHETVRKWAVNCIFFFVIAYALATVVTILHVPHMLDRMKAIPWLFIVPAIALFSIVNIALRLQKKQDGWAFISSLVCIAMLLSLFAIGTFPYMIRSSLDPAANSLLISNSASSQLTLKVLLTIVGIGLPLVFAYGFYIYRTFRGKVKLSKGSY